MKKMTVAGFSTDQIKEIMERIKHRCAQRQNIEDRDEKRDIIWSFAEITILDDQGDEQSIHVYDVAKSGVGLIGDLEFEVGDKFCYIDPETGWHYDFIVRHSELFDTTVPGLYQTGGELILQDQTDLDVHEIFKRYDFDEKPQWAKNLIK